jgi:putative glutathione S-transferase
MGLLIQGEWHDRWYDTASTGGRFQRQESGFRSWVTADGAPGPTGAGGFKAEPGRYHLYVSLSCPWACRTLMMRRLKGLSSIIGISITHWLMGDRGWTFEDGPGVVPDPIFGARYLYQIYQAAVADYTGRVTVPVLWDKHRRTIVNNESSEIIRMLNGAFDGVGATQGDYYPRDLRADIDAVNARIYDTVNNGVYKAGLATTQAAYDEAVGPLFESLDWLEARLARRRYLMGDRLTEADVRLFPTLVRFDTAYYGHFKCNLRRIVDYPNLWAYTRDLYQLPGIAETVNFQHIKGGYYQSLTSINPTGIVPAGPILDFSVPHHREPLGGTATHGG